MSLFDDAPEGAPAAPGAATAIPPVGDPAPAKDLTGKPDWMPDSFWQAPEEGGTADYAAMAEKLAGSVKSGQQKITELSEKVAKHAVPEHVAPYTEGLDVDALLKANPRSGWTPERVEQAVAQARGAGVGPGAFQAFMQSHLKALHESTPEAQSVEQRHDAAVAELNAAGRPGSEMAKRVRAWGAGLKREGNLSEAQERALGELIGSAGGLELAHSVMGAEHRPVPGSTGTATRATQAIVEKIDAMYADERFGVDMAFTAEVERLAQQNDAALATKYKPDSMADADGVQWPAAQ